MTTTFIHLASFLSYVLLHLRCMVVKKNRPPSFSSCGKTDFPFCQAVDSSNKGTRGEVYISRMVEQVAKPGVMFRDTWFAGGRVLRCFHGRFYVRLEGCESIELSEGETIVSYPERHITIEALDNSNLLAYVVLEGRGTAAYFDRLGFFNGVHGPTSPQIELFREIKHRLESRHTGERDGLMVDSGCPA